MILESETATDGVRVEDMAERMVDEGYDQVAEDERYRTQDMIEAARNRADELIEYYATARWAQTAKSTRDSEHPADRNFDQNAQEPE
jgi:hypothetical protein